MEPIEFISFAGRTVTLGKAGARSAISRAYYGLFHIAQELIFELTAESVRSGKGHNLIPLFVLSANHAAGNLAARILSDLHTQRIRADYQLSLPSVEVVDSAKVHIESALEAQVNFARFRSEYLADPQLLQRLREGVARVKSLHQT